jgi:hypothetical protein
MRIAVIAKSWLSCSTWNPEQLLTGRKIIDKKHTHCQNRHFHVRLQIIISGSFNIPAFRLIHCYGHNKSSKEFI